MTFPRPDGPLPAAVGEFLDSALGRAHRDEPIATRTGGPAGNARLTSWLGLVLLVLLALEGGTLLAMHQLIGVHIFLGTLIVPPVLLKTATTGWRIARYYLGSSAYHQAGPPPLILRLLGPLVIVTSLAVLGTGLALIVTSQSGREPFARPLGFGVSVLALHQASVIGWVAVTAVHVLGRTVPALRTVSTRLIVPGRATRGLLLTGTAAVGVIAAVVVLQASTAWTSDQARFRPPPGVGPRH
jgi:hypothetical protein